MGRWAAALLLLFPATAAAAPAMLPVRRPPASVPAYAALVPAGFASPATGWGFRATIGGRHVDPGAPPELWQTDSMLGARESEVGVGWRGRHASAVVGYGALDFGSRAAGSDGGMAGLIDAPRRRTSGVIGLNLVLRPR